MAERKANEDAGVRHLRPLRHLSPEDRAETQSQNGWRPPTVDPTLPLRYFSIHRELKDLAAAEPCPFCGAATVPTLIPYWIEGSEEVIIAPETPGFSCTGCGAELFDPLIDVDLITAAASLLDPVRDASLRAMLYERAADICRQFAERQTTQVVNRRVTVR